uniref:Uncharacterized protein n=1 Tax=Eutreptiella gymnastica TaxID=73025 RepID=A0A7S1NT70_9EUGL
MIMEKGPQTAQISPMAVALPRFAVAPKGFGSRWDSGHGSGTTMGTMRRSLLPSHRKVVHTLGSLTLHQPSPSSWRTSFAIPLSLFLPSHSYVFITLTIVFASSRLV